VGQDFSPKYTRYQAPVMTMSAMFALFLTSFLCFFYRQAQFAETMR
jgi:ABC-type multidrug transport system permease subunit